MLAGVLGRLALGVVEVGGDGDDRLRDLLAELGFGGLLHLLQDEGGDLLRGILLAVGFDPGVAVRAFDDLVGDELLVLLDHRVIVAAADEALDGEEVLSGLVTAWRLAGRPTSFSPSAVNATMDGVVFMPSAFSRTLGFAALHHCHARVRGSEVDADYFCHVSILIFCGGPSGPELSASRKSGVRLTSLRAGFGPLWSIQTVNAAYIRCLF